MPYYSQIAKKSEQGSLPEIVQIVRQDGATLLRFFGYLTIEHCQPILKNIAVSNRTDAVLARLAAPSVQSSDRHLVSILMETFIANQLIFSYDIYANLSVFAQYSGKICMKD